MNNVSDEEAEAPQQKRQRVDEDGKEKNESLNGRFGLFTGFFGARAHSAIPRCSVPSMNK